ncbi:DASH family cryptochrome [Marinibactrum halimedae]|uniref:DASH family cryptochrome n=1 Tax=Marinibactrum halimedae TaxID=1444977 RepID=UPI001E2FA4E8|nr:DASH family cryptochrome [Marinibactrum halimedae]MCD9461034.1 DASH family cryptochrome [Marinibactrum halimedae]
MNHSYSSTPTEITGERHTTGIMWFTNDLRLHDNATLRAAGQQCDQLVCVYVVQSEPSHHQQLARQHQRIECGLQGVGRNRLRQQFEQESLGSLSHGLRLLGQELLILQGAPLEIIAQCIQQYRATAVFSSVNAGWYENQTLYQLKQHYPQLALHRYHTHTLFEPAQVNLERGFAQTFSKFRRQMESVGTIDAKAPVSKLPPSPIFDQSANKQGKNKGVNANYVYIKSKEDVNSPGLYSSSLVSSEEKFTGGEYAALDHISAYFDTKKRLPSQYKLVRNALDGWEHSTKLSAWLANGCLSVREVVKILEEYEGICGANESTYWIYFELLWREYFQWYAHYYGLYLYRFSGIKKKKPLTSFYPQRFQQWCEGTTPFTLVNACMIQLKTTGYLSNRGRQIVASCFVNELNLDWRYGAAYFEKTLIDYDVAANWGNWQYLAGVGADPRGKRHFDLKKQTQQYDPDGIFQKKWATNVTDNNLILDAVDAADWPLDPDSNRASL